MSTPHPDQLAAGQAGTAASRDPSPRDASDSGGTRGSSGTGAAAGPGVVSSLRRHVEVLAAAPRNRGADPAHLCTARRYVMEQLHAAGWTLTEQPFTTPTGLGVSDAGYPLAHLWPLRIRGPVEGVNIIATRGRPITKQTLVVLAHLDSVRNSPGADDNASGVAVILQAAAQIPDPDNTGSSDLDSGRDVALVLVDLEEISLAGSTHLAKTVTPGAVLNLESVGYYDRAPHSQRLPLGLSLAAPPLAQQICGRRSAGDFALVVHRPDSAPIAGRWAAAAEQAGLPTVVHQDNRHTGAGWRLERLVNPVGANLDRSDHAPFWNAGVPAVVVCDTAPLRARHYHRPSDTPDTLDYPALAAVTTATIATARAWQTTDLNAHQ